MGKATESTLSDLHGIVAEEFINRISKGAATPADLNAARQFLKDNGISCDGPRNPRLNTLMDNMPDEMPGEEWNQ